MFGYSFPLNQKSILTPNIQSMLYLLVHSVINCQIRVLYVMYKITKRVRYKNKMNKLINTENDT